MLLELANVIVLSLDDLGWDEWNVVEPPRLEALREAGVTFTRAYAMPNCSPSRFAWQFGEYGARHGIGFPIKAGSDGGTHPREVVSLPEMMAGLGFRTAHFGKWHLTGKNADISDFKLAPNLHGYEDAFAWSVGNLGADQGKGFVEWTRYDNGAVKTETAYATTAVLDAFVGWWKRHDGERRFAHIALHAPHTPFHAPPVELLPDNVTLPLDPTDEQLFEAMMLATDTAIGRALRACEDLSDALLLVFADNGTTSEISSAPQGAKGTLFEEGINVPFFAIGEGVPRGVRDDRLVHVVDIPATIASLIGVPEELVPPGDGISFAGSLGGEDRGPRRWIYAESFAPNGPGPHTKDQRAVRTVDDWKLHVNLKTGVETLYRLPDESTPVLDAAKTAELLTLIDSLQLD